MIKKYKQIYINKVKPKQVKTNTIESCIASTQYLNELKASREDERR